MTSDDIYKKRWQKAVRLFKKHGIECLYINNEAERIYFSGFTGTFGVLLILADKRYIFTDSRYTKQAEDETNGFEIIKYERASYYKNLISILAENGIRNLGFENDTITWDEYKKLEDNLKGMNLVPAGDLPKKLRAVKDSYEIGMIKEAVSLTDKAFYHILKFIKPGISEKELSAEIEYYLRKNGAKSSSFPTIAASGIRSAMPHGVASDKKLENGDIITFDFGALYKSYCSDITRTVFLGNPDPKLKKIYNIVLRAQSEAEKVIKAGMTAVKADRAARNIIEEEGFGSEFGHGLGHGVGIEVHETPFLSPLSKDRLLEGMVVTVEPGIYLPDRGGVRIEDMILVGKDNSVILTEAKKDMIII